MTPKGDDSETEGLLRDGSGGGVLEVDLGLPWTDSGNCGCSREVPM